MVVDAPDRDGIPPRRFEAVPANITIEHRMAAREIEAIIRRAFVFGDENRERLELVALAIAHAMTVRMHGAYELIHDTPLGRA